MPTGILEIKLGSQAKTLKAIHQLAVDCNRARNKVMWEWRKWRDDNSDWEPQQRRLRDGSPKVTTAGKPVMETAMVSQDVENQLYHRARDVAPKVSANVVSHCRGQVMDWLKGRMPWSHNGEAKYRWQAVLNCEINPHGTTFRSLEIPIPTKDTRLIYDDDHCVLDTQLFSKQSGRENCRVQLRLLAGKLTHGNRKVMKKIASGEWRMADSRLVLTDRGNGFWAFQLCYKIPTAVHDLDLTNAVTILPTRDGKRPFRLDYPDGSWQAGDGKALAVMHSRLEARRQGIRSRYRKGQVGKGHGKADFYKTTRPWSRDMINMQNNFVKKLASEIVKLCIRERCGKVVYREPSLPLRNHLWFTRNSAPFDWTQFGSYLRFSLQKHGIEVEDANKSQLGVKEHQQIFGWSGKQKRA